MTHHRQITAPPSWHGSMGNHLAAACPSCTDGNIITSLLAGDDPNPNVRKCQDCTNGIVTGDLATLVQILEAAHALQNMMIAARDQRINANVTRNLQSAIDALDCIIADDITEGSIWALTKEHA